MIFFRGIPASILCWIFLPAFAIAQPVDRYALVLDEPAVVNRFATREQTRSAEAGNYRLQIQSTQHKLLRELSSRNIPVTGSVSTVLNAIFVIAPGNRANELRGLPGVAGVVRMRRHGPVLNQATLLVNAPVAWGALAGMQNAGRGMKIAILDTGIEQTHPAFQDDSLAMPPGYPRCAAADCAFTTNKVIAARSYVRQLAAGSDPKDPAKDSRPDDYSPRDRSGHGTAAASCAAANTTSGAVTFSGLAPKAYLGNYKIYGSPGVNEFTTDDVIVQAIEDAYNDGMDIINFSTSSPALTGALDAGSICGNNSGVPCDLTAKIFEDLARMGLVIVAAAGNYGDNAMLRPALNSIASPADAPSVIAVGSTTNAHTFQPAISVQGAGVPANLKKIPAQSGDGRPLQRALTAPLRDAALAGNDGFACSPLTPGSMAGAIALIQRGPGADGCAFSTKLGNAQNAGAVAVIFYAQDSSPLPPGGLGAYNISAVIVSNTDGLALKSFIAANPGRQATIDPAGIEQSATPNQLASALSFQPGRSFSSLGPGPGDLAIKPELVAPGTNMYMAFQTYDVLGDLYSGSGYGVAGGTSFSAPLVSAAAALVKQKHPGFSAAQVKSALVNTASQDVLTDVSGTPVNVIGIGAGKLDAGAAVNSNVTCVPSTLSFGAIAQGSLPKAIPLTIANSGAGTVNLTLTVVQGKASGTALTLDRQNVLLSPGTSAVVTATLSGSAPLPGSYYGAIAIQGPGISLRVPYLYLTGNGAPANIIALTGLNFDGTVGERIPQGLISFKLVDSYGVPAANVPVTFSTPSGGTLENVDRNTDANGVAAATPALGPQPGNYSFVAIAGGLRVTFSGIARPRPNIPARSILNGASFDPNGPIAPGSYITIFGTGLIDGNAAGSASTARLPLSIDRVIVSFDVPSAGISVPGHLVFVNSTQVNVQAPWELQGQSSVQVKVSVNFSPSNVVTAPVAPFAPALFEGTPGIAAALDENYRPLGPGNPVRAGQTVQLFANGLGPVTNQPASGDPAPASPLAQTTTTPVVSIGGQPATVAFSGLAPGFAGLYQVNVIVPEGLAPGIQPLTITMGTITSKPSGLAVK